jgi:hypothetical protein
MPTILYKQDSSQQQLLRVFVHVRWDGKYVNSDSQTRRERFSCLVMRRQMMEAICGKPWDRDHMLRVIVGNSPLDSNDTLSFFMKCRLADISSINMAFSSYTKQGDSHQLQREIMGKLKHCLRHRSSQIDYCRFRSDLGHIFTDEFP